MKIKIFLSFLVHLMLVNAVFGQWIQTDGPYGNSRTSFIFENRNSLYSGTSCGLYKTENVSGRWRPITAINFDVFSKKGDSLFLGGRNSGIRLLNLSDPSSEIKLLGLNSYTVKVIKAIDTCLFAGIEVVGFCKSIGFSGKYEYFNTGLPYEVKSIPKSGDTYFARYINAIEVLHGKLICGTHKGIYTSEISNIAWQVVNKGIPEQNISLIKVFNDILYACTANAIYSSSDGGNSWNELYTASSTISSVHKYKGVLYITTSGNGIYQSEDDGLTWTSFNDGLSDMNVTVITNSDTTLICGTFSSGVYFFNGASWINNSRGIVCSSIQSMENTNSAIVANDANHVYLSTEGKSWINISPAVDKKYFGSLTTKGDTVFLAYKDNLWTQYLKYYTVSDHTWQDLVKNPPYGGDDTYRMYTLGDNFYAGEDDRMYVTNDLGSTWKDISLTSNYCNLFFSFISYKSDIFASACGNAQLLKLVDNNWVLSNSGLPSDREVLSLAKSSDALYAYVYAYGMFISLDNGRSWRIANNGLVSNTGIHSYAYKGKNIFVTTDSGVYYTDDYGQNWHLLNSGLINTNAGPLVIKNDTLFVGTYGNGIWKHDIQSIPLADTAFPDTLSAMEDRLSICPNPASRVVTVQSTIKDKSKIIITDIMGHQVFVNDNFYNGTIDLSGIQNGIYTIRLDSKGKKLTGKLMINK